jgi:hypothetical protein
MRALDSIAAALRGQGVLDPAFDVHRLVMAGVTELAPD